MAAARERKRLLKTLRLGIIGLAHRDRQLVLAFQLARYALCVLVGRERLIVVRFSDIELKYSYCESRHERLGALCVIHCPNALTELIGGENENVTVEFAGSEVGQKLVVVDNYTWSIQNRFKIFIFGHFISLVYVSFQYAIGIEDTEVVSFSVLTLLGAQCDTLEHLVKLQLLLFVDKTSVPLHDAVQESCRCFRSRFERLVVDHAIAVVHCNLRHSVDVAYRDFLHYEALLAVDVLLENVAHVLSLVDVSIQYRVGTKDLEVAE